MRDNLYVRTYPERSEGSHNKMDRKKLALIHIIKKELNLSDQEYRDILQKAAGVNSAKELDDYGFRKLMRYFVRSKYYRLNPSGLTMRQKLFIDYLARQLEWTKKHLDNFINKYFHRPDVYGLSKKEAIKVIEALKNVIRHRGENIAD